MYRRHRGDLRDSSRRRSLVCATLALLLAASAIGSVDASPARAIESPGVSSEVDSADLRARGWQWPAASYRVSHPFVAPAHDYAPGHRGIDLDLSGTTAVLAPADGIIAFAGSVAGRGVVTIDHGDGLVTTLEPVDTTLVAGTMVSTGDNVGTLGSGGHVVSGELHFGVRLDGKYINPMLLLAEVPRAILLPCCS